ncbi:SusC/RagA family TonB-linked outer membrane protein [Haoranjiania flava]|uniref:SusC/RagA family TonB-linked outer membrane protein n=1 Tax=Haoranjiania flava TaxID=1856322 RepID=A0AAE3ILW8_9BACT|nr:SusC/RagA family TonB-linked outer membrane protein [Haoranjiania flava]MCU7693593.1 SusC/RagA family TonB-linked outer membrane protein [Haoranjiania flava]
MSKIFKGLIVLLLVFTVSASMAQTKEVTGKVTDVEGAPVAGATVRVVGGRAGTATDANGEFKFNVLNQIQAVTVSALGYQEKTVSLTGGFLNINLVRGEAATEAGSEVVVTALGVTRDKKSLGYATQTIKGNELNQAANTSLSGAIQGKTAGVEIKPSSGMPGASSVITIRGARSFTGNNSPLYVIDGLPVSSTSDISTGNSVTGTDYANRGIDINPNDIENIEILKGQAASALYGLRASNGVIVITTKKGARGAARITFNSNVSFDKLSRFPDLQKTYAQGSAGEYNPNASTSWGPKITDLPKSKTYGGETDNVYTQKDGMKPGMYYVPQLANAGLNPWIAPGVYDNVKDFFNTGQTFNNSINVSQGNEKNIYSFSLASTNQKGIVPHTGMERYNARLAGESKLSERFKTSFAGNFVTSNIDKAPTANDGIMATVFPAPPSYNLKGIPDHYAGNDDRPNGYRGGAFVNPYWGMRKNSFNEKTNRFFGNSSVTYNNNLGTDNLALDVKYQLGTDVYTTNYQDIWSFGSTTRGSNNNGTIEEYSFTNNMLNSLLTANLRWDINNDLNLTTLIGNEIVNTSTIYKYAYGSDFAFAGWNHMDNTAIKDASSTYKQNRTFGTFINLNLAYKNMLYLTATGRQDIVSSMPRNNRVFYYPSVGVSFVFTELESLKDNSTLSYGKIRASYAQVGQAGSYLPNYYTIPAYGGGFYSGTPIIYPIEGIKGYIPSTTIYDGNLKPQNTNSIETGIDLGFLRGVIDFSYTFSRQDVTDQIFAVPLAGSTGASSFMTNGGKVHTNAHEATLNFNAIRKTDIDWNFGFNFSKIDNYVDELAEDVESIFLGGFVTPQVRAGIGDKFPVIYGSTYKRDKNGRIVVGADGLPMAGAPGVIGRVSPDFILGANTSFRYKDLTLSAVAEWKNGGQMYSGSTGLFGLYGVSRESGEARDRNEVMFPGAVKEDGTPNDIKITGYKNIQDYFSALNNIDESSIVESSFFKMREIALRYKAVKKANFGLELNVFARNLLLWTNSPYLDPESSQGNTNMAGAFERFTLPQTSSFGMGINLQF